MLVTDKGVGRLAAEVEVNATDGQVHRRQTPGGWVGFLTIDGNITEFAAMGFDELFRLHKHTTGAAAGIIDLAMVRVKHSNQRFDDTSRRIELPALLAFSAGELAEEVFIDLAEQVAGLVSVATKADRRN
ncbi:hypothetical protein D3C81_798120 [compost metagenome]